MLIREALHNAVRHGAPKNLSVVLTFGGGAVDVTIEDDGSGFDPLIIDSLSGHYGLIGMRERVERLGGKLRLTSSPGSGTEVRLSIPALKSRLPQSHR